MSVGSFDMPIDLLLPVAIIALGLGLVTALLVAGLRTRRGRALAEALQASGQPAPATILHAKDGTMSGPRGGPYRKDIRLELEVRPRDRTAFRARATVYQAEAGDSVRPGQALLVRFDPADPSIVAVDPGSFRTIADEVALQDLLEQEGREDAAKDLLRRG